MKNRVQNTLHTLACGWYYALIALFLAAAAALYLLCGENSHIAVHDNLELFQAQYQMMKNQGSFFRHGSAAPFLGGVNRDLLPSEFSLTTLLYVLLPSSFAAYIANWFVKLLLAAVSFSLLAGELLCAPAPAHGAGAASAAFTPRERSIVVLCGFAYGLLNLFPNFGIPFASIPLYIWFFVRLYRAQTRRSAAPYLTGLFLYPFLSYFSYFGLFLLAYSSAAFLLLWFRSRRPPLRLLCGIIAASAGFMLFEYRLFGQMLFSDTVTIRSSFVAGDLSAPRIFSEILTVFRNGIFHADSLQARLVLPVCAVYFLYRNFRNVITGKWRDSFHDPFNLCMALLAFNAVVYGLYYSAPCRDAVEMLLPPLRGWQFNRTVFFSPFLWYAAFCLVCLRLCRFGEKRRFRPAGPLASALCLAACAVILLSGTRYNDLYSTARALAMETLRGSEPDELSYREFYSTELFEEIKKDLNYRIGDLSTGERSPSGEIEAAAVRAGQNSGRGQNAVRPAQDDDAAKAQTGHDDDGGRERGVQVSGADGTDWAVAYGLNPAILEYNGIATLDGYLGFYPQSYKDAFRAVIAPALDRRPASAAYYDEWGAKCFLYSGDEDSIVQAVRNYQSISSRIYIDAEALRALGCRYVFSRIELSNAGESGLVLRGTYTEPHSPYTVYVYEFSRTARGAF
ncbi:DUF6044 family protein [Lachnoclostridium sp. Marseille-P6806]|uniref:DUF6044 family protein n=1 Tax=Lachnoclostridium sp. Marseille-P6806 TaxID=2364793 RepID=UPI001030BE1B|nr:DUF6044 family protein [Lachnoclostridium sp. Marseille-P6806]